MNILPCEFFKHNGTAQLKINDELNIDIGSQITELNRGRYMLGIRAHHLSVLRENETLILNLCPIITILNITCVLHSPLFSQRLVGLIPQNNNDINS